MPKKLNEEQLQSKRRLILNAAREVFSQNGYAESTMAQIAEKAGLPLSSLYNYFRNKKDIFESANLQEDVYTFRPEYDRKRKAILDVSLQLMGQRGYSAVTLDEISAKLGTPKASFYSFFSGKEELFSALLTESPLQESAYELEPDPDDPTCQSGLRSIGQSFLDMGDIPERTAIFRMALHESAENPEVGRLFYSEGISKVCDTLAAYIRANCTGCTMSDGELKLFSWLFLSSLWASNIMFKVINGTVRDFSDKQILDMSASIFSSWLSRFDQPPAKPDK